METNILEFLEKDLVKIEKKMSKAIEEDNFGTYKNLLDATDRILKMLNQYGNEYKQMWSKYKDENGVQHVSVWKQNKDNDIKEHYDFTVNNVYIKEPNIPVGVKVKTTPIDDACNIKLPNMCSKEEFIKNIQDYDKNKLVIRYINDDTYYLIHFNNNFVNTYIFKSVDEINSFIKASCENAKILLDIQTINNGLCDKILKDTNNEYHKIWANVIK